MLFWRGRPHPAGNRQQRVSTLRPEPRERCAFQPGDIVGLAAVDPVGLSWASVPFRVVFASVRGAGMNAPGGVPEIDITGVTKQYGNSQLVLESIDLAVAKQEFISIIVPSG